MTKRKLPALLPVGAEVVLCLTVTGLVISSSPLRQIGGWRTQGPSQLLPSANPHLIELQRLWSESVMQAGRIPPRPCGRRLSWAKGLSCCPRCPLDFNERAGLINLPPSNLNIFLINNSASEPRFDKLKRPPFTFPVRPLSPDAFGSKSKGRNRS